MMVRFPLRLSLPRDQAIGTSSSGAALRHYAAPAKSSSSGGKKKETGPRGSRGLDAGDSRNEVIRKVRLTPFFLLHFPFRR